MKKTFLAFIAAAAMSASCSNAQTVVEQPMLRLNNGIEMPQFGIGTFMMPSNEVCKDAVLTALRAGYRHIDTAHAYNDEPGVGEAVREFCAESGVPRSEIWVTSKIWPNEYEDSLAVDKMLERLGLDYVDLVYPHQPVGNVKTAWRNLEKAVHQGKVRCLGLSNFEVPEAMDIYRWCVDSTEVKPVILQMECHPYAQRLKEKKRIVNDNMMVECWYPLGGAQSRGALFKDPVIMDIAKAHNVTPAQVIIAWHIQEGHSVIPGATDHGYIQENIDALKIKLTEEEMSKMRGLNKEDRFFKVTWEQVKRFGGVRD